MGHEWPKPHGGAAWGPTAPGTEEGDSGTSPSPPFDYITLSDLKREGVRPLFQKTSRTPPPSKTLFRGSETPFWHPAGTEKLEEIIAIIITAASPSTIHDSPIHV